MPVSFRRLRIAGFKSFAEPASVEILPGLTGIVGPNGCGKSNVVEALRWAMGESSARSLRGGEMEDVIFAGTAGRASRNIAEVTVFLDEAAGRAPPPFHEQAELEIVRRIERGSGSAYRINGREARARDVQTLFADLASGSRASAMVSQGRVGALVGARPEERRAVLEEAANITGLHARRHEAELKLRAAEANLARAEDLRAQLENQLGNLKRQARQASRYRNISAAIRLAEAELLSLQRARVALLRDQAAAALHDAAIAVAAATDAATAAATRAAEATAALPPLRETEANARTVLERLRLSREQLAREEQQARTALGEAQRRIGQLSSGSDARRSVAAGCGGGGPASGVGGDRSCTVGSGARRTRGRGGSGGDRGGRHRQAGRSRGQSRHRGRGRGQCARAGGGAVARTGPTPVETAARAVLCHRPGARTDRRAAGRSGNADTRHEGGRRGRSRPDLGEGSPRPRGTGAGGHSHRTRSGTRQTGNRGFGTRRASGGNPGARGNPGGQGRRTLAADDRFADRGRRAGSRIGRGAGGGTDLGPRSRGSAALARAAGVRTDSGVTARRDPAGRFGARTAGADPSLSQIGLVDTEGDGLDNQSNLSPGQSLVSRTGAMWRWDGYTVRSGTPTQAAVRLQQRNRLIGLRTRLAAAEHDAAAVRTARATAETASQAAVAAEQVARNRRRECEQKLERARSSLAALRHQAATATARLAAADDLLARVTAERDEASAALAQLRAAQSALPDLAGLRAAVDEVRATLSAARAQETAARGERDTLIRDHNARVSRRRAITAERAGWAERAKDVADRVADLTLRQNEADATLQVLQTRPAELAATRVQALDALTAAEAGHRRAAEALAAALTQATEADRAARAAEANVAARREDAVRAEATAQQARPRLGTVAERILERLGANPALPDPPSDLSHESEEKTRRRLERQLKEREEMGPVNLRAEQEADDVEKQIGTIESEREELTTAIAKLRGSIGHLNREGRERLTAVFQEVDQNFQQLFSRMFGGGRAHLALVGSDDPLEAGLEIFAQPPGKKLAALSLLSGGEQALTALSLIFAVFRCNPAPVCVLDEVDAPLDDANVERFCTLLEDMVRDTGTRFLVVTHHPLTMARMDRLYGVTMQERGVSRLLSVDLARATDLIDQPALAAE